MKKGNRICFENYEIYKNLGGIYMIQNTINGKYYIGSTKNFVKRWLYHSKDLRINRSSSVILQRAYNKYGFENFRFIPIKVLEDLTVENLLKEEQEFLDKEKPIYNSMPNATTVGRKREFSTIEKQKITLLKYFENLQEDEKSGNMRGVEVINTLTGETKKYRSMQKLQKDLKIGYKSILRVLSGKLFWKKELRHLTLKEY